jgi:hypothetical protein
LHTAALQAGLRDESPWLSWELSEAAAVDLELGIHKKHGHAPGAYNQAAEAFISGLTSLSSQFTGQQWVSLLLNKLPIFVTRETYRMGQSRMNSTGGKVPRGLDFKHGTAIAELETSRLQKELVEQKRMPDIKPLKVDEFFSVAVDVRVAKLKELYAVLGQVALLAECLPFDSSITDIDKLTQMIEQKAADEAEDASLEVAGSSEQDMYNQGLNKVKHEAHTRPIQLLKCLAETYPALATFGSTSTGSPTGSRRNIVEVDSGESVYSPVKIMATNGDSNPRVSTKERQSRHRSRYPSSYGDGSASDSAYGWGQHGRVGVRSKGA